MIWCGFLFLGNFLIMLGIMNKIPGDILEIAKKVRKEIITQDRGMTGACWEGSYRLYELLQKYEATIVHGVFNNPHIKPHKDSNNTHYWVILRKINNMILDVTADQFEYYLKEKIGEIVFGSQKILSKYYHKLRIVRLLEISPINISPIEHYKVYFWR
jgi:hypothetical protein